ncbi:MAG: ribbon-helix-helix protein, CopG family [Fibrobacterota bacterium]
MAAYTVNISFEGALVRQIDSVARIESRSRSELIREAARMYIQRKNRWKELFRKCRRAGKASGLSEKDVIAEVRRVRASV